MLRNDARAKTSDADFIRDFETIGPSALARKLGVTKRNVFARRATLENGYGRQIASPDQTYRGTRRAEEHARVLQYRVDNGIVLIGSDAHIWPGKPSTAMRAFTKFCKDQKPELVILNGDVLDFPQVSRHPPIGHAKLPNIADEIECAQEQLNKIELATARSCKLIWTLGNHDSRFETRLATVAPEFAKLHGHSLKDHFPAWSACWRCDINDDVTVKHRHKGGIHATHNSTLWAGRTMITGHLHSQKVAPFTDYSGTRWGVDTGCLASPDAEAFSDYTEMNPLNWRSGFAVMTFKDGKLLPPELVTVWDDKHVVFRGTLIAV
jgi:predicted phosphodiesterase